MEVAAGRIEFRWTTLVWRSSIRLRQVGSGKVANSRHQFSQLRPSPPRMTGGLRALRHPLGGVKGADGILHVVSVQKTIRTFQTFQHRLGLRHRPKLALSLDVPRVKSPPLAQVQVDRAPVADNVLAFVVQSAVHTRANVFVTVVIANLACVARSVASTLVLVRMRLLACFLSS